MSIQHEQAPINGTDAGDAEAKVADLEPEPLMTPEEHVIALTLLLKQVSMENEHLKLSMSQCEVRTRSFDYLPKHRRLADFAHQAEA